jgi:hypothetical protein
MIGVSVPVELDEPVPVWLDDGVPVWLDDGVPVWLDEPVPVELDEPVPVELDEPVPVWLAVAEELDVTVPVELGEPVPVELEEAVPVKLDVSVPVWLPVGLVDGVTDPVGLLDGVTEPVGLSDGVALRDTGQAGTCHAPVEPHPVDTIIVVMWSAESRVADMIVPTPSTAPVPTVSVVSVHVAQKGRMAPAFRMAPLCVARALHWLHCRRADMPLPQPPSTTSHLGPFCVASPAKATCASLLAATYHTALLTLPIFSLTMPAG